MPREKDRNFYRDLAVSLGTAAIVFLIKNVPIAVIGVPMYMRIEPISTPIAVIGTVAWVALVVYCVRKHGPKGWFSLIGLPAILFTPAKVVLYIILVLTH